MCVVVQQSQSGGGKHRNMNLVSTSRLGGSVQVVSSTNGDFPVDDPSGGEGRLPTMSPSGIEVHERGYVAAFHKYLFNNLNLYMF